MTTADAVSSETKVVPPAPFVKAAGGKTKSLPTILPIVAAALADSEDPTYHEPFVGGGAVFLAIAARRPDSSPLPARIADVNRELIAAYKAVRGQPEALLARLREHRRRHTAEGATYYYEERARTANVSVDVVEVGARFMYLNRTCFNGLYRLNRSGQFNVPMGKYANPRIVDEDGVMAVSAALRHTTINRQSFDVSFRSVQEGDVVYCDPPYLPLDANSFTQYQAEPFGEAEHRALARECAVADDRGVFVVASNADTPLARELYPESRWVVQRVMVARAINSKASGRGKVGEILVHSRRS